MLTKHLLDVAWGLRSKAPTLNLRDRNVLRAALHFSAALMVGSEKVLEKAVEAIPNEVNPFLQSLKAYYVRHLAEERGHFNWLMDDLEEPFKVDWNAAEIVGAQYYAIEHWTPVALLGYLLVMEAFPMPMELVSALEELHGKKLLRCVRYHAEHDLEHREELYQMLNSVPESYAQIIEQNVVHTLTLFSIAQKSWGV